MKLLFSIMETQVGDQVCFLEILSPGAFFTRGLFTYKCNYCLERVVTYTYIYIGFTANKPNDVHIEPELIKLLIFFKH